MLLTKEQEKHVISYLKENFKLPEKGIVAGQAVASLVYKELNLDIPFFINDVDVFINEEFDSRSSLPNRSIESVLAPHGGSGRDLYFKNKTLRSYRVINSCMSEEDSQVNLISVHCKSFDMKYSTEIDTLDIINSFDLNCTCVGFNLENNKIVYTTSFESFCKTKQLRVNSIYTPYHTSLRLVKKVKTLKNIFCNIKQEMACLFFNKRISKEVWVGEKFMNEYELFANKEMKDIFSFKLSGDYLKDNNSPKLGFIKLNNENLNHFFQDNNFNFCELDYEINSSSMCVHLFHIHNNTGVFTQSYKDQINSIKERIEYHLILNDMILSPLNKINLDYKKGKISKIEDMLKNHPYLINQFQGLDTERTLFLLRELYMKSERSKDKKFIIGAVEMGIINPNEICKIIDLSVSEGIDFLFERAGNNDNIPKIKKINTSLFKLKPLISIKDFAKDAIKHKTCILGHYNNAVYNEKAVYYSLEVGKETASVYLYDGKIIQYYGINNAELPSFRHTIIKILLEIIHGRKLKSIISDIIAPKKSSIFSRVYKIINNRKRKTNTSNVYREPIIDFDDDIPF